MGNRVLVPVALAGGICIGILDMRASEVQTAVALLLALSFVYGFCSPRQSWLWFLLIGAGVPVVHLIAPLFGFAPTYPVSPNVFATCLAFVPAAIGAFTGAALASLKPNRA